jgi:CobQ-like glutamine amidotransferase family enzyme
VGLEEEFDPSAHHLFYLGGGQDRDQQLCAKDLVKTKREHLHQAAGRGAVVFAVCGGYQLLGNYYEAGGERLEGVELLDLRTVNSGGKRLIGNVAIEVGSELLSEHDGESSRVLAGFENHGGRTYLGSGLSPLGQVLRGHGNNGEDGGEGAVGGPEKNIIGTYLHGPLLPKNAWFADLLIAKSLGVELSDLPDSLEREAHISARQAAGV